MLYELYERRLVSEIDRTRVPRHIGILLDGNRRWAKALGSPAEHGHQKGADKISEVLEWCEEMGVEVVTLWMLSLDNLNRDPQEVAQLEEIIASTVEQLSVVGQWQVRVMGALDQLPTSFADRLSNVDASGSGPGMVVNVAIGYSGREEIVHAVKSLIKIKTAEGVSMDGLAASLTVDDITEHLYTRGLPDPDLLIRTSGEQRLSGFLLWQSAHSEYYFCETYWPDFRRVDFLRALRDYAQRERRMGR
ncbi:MAG: isoprenyl transferase [Actinomycetaceae bacterium]|nr:isoprenyl transferase [Actinomycetaceae bacterium]